MKIDHELIKSLQARLGRVPQTKHKRPYFFELTGPPATGKSTAIVTLDDLFRRNGYNVAVPPEGARVIRDVSRDTHLYNVSTGMYALKNMVESLKSNFDMVILDRGLFDVIGWMKYWVKKKDITTQNAKEIISYFVENRWYDMLDAVFIIIADVEVATKRKEDVSIAERTGNTSGPETMRLLRECFLEAYDEYGLREKTFIIDTSNSTPKEVGREILPKVLSCMERRFE